MPPIRSALRTGCLSIFGIFLLFIVFIGLLSHARFQAKIWEFKISGGAPVLRAACQELKPALLESRDRILLFRDVELPPENPLHKLRPQFIILGSHDGTDVYTIQISGGFYHAGYIIFDDKDKAPEKLRYGQNGNWKVKHIGEGVFVYQE